LEITVSGGDRDGFPSERSERVRAAAAMALHHCVQCFIEVVTVEPPLKDKDKEQEKEREQEGLVRAGEAKGEHGLLPAADDAPAGGAKDKSANKPSSNKPDRELILRALRTLENAEFRSVNPLDPTQSRFRDRGVFDIIGDAVFPPEVEGGMIVPDAAPALPAPRVLPGVPVEAAPAPSPYSGLQGRATPAPAPAQPVRTVVITAQVPSETHSGEALVVRAVGTGGAQPVRQTAAAEAQEPSEVIRRCLSVMATATAAADRHKAIHVLASYDCRTHPEVLSGLARSARHDREPAVRVDCLRRLAALGVATPEVLAELKAVCADPDPWVREEAVQAMARLQGQGR
ncbi:MAG TPA: HEAT repeat domain-containing protein, partial [Gemmataceae bacterium]